MIKTTKQGVRDLNYIKGNNASVKKYKPLPELVAQTFCHHKNIDDVYMGGTAPVYTSCLDCGKTFNM